MGRAPCCDKANVKRGPWSPEEDMKLKEFIEKHGTGGNWIALPHKAGLKRCGKSCRLRWLNYLRPNIKHGEFSDAEDRIICSLFASIGSKWSIIAGHLPGRTDNDIKNYWNTKLKRKLLGISPSQRKLNSDIQQTQQQQVLSSFQLPTMTTPFPTFQLPSNHFLPCLETSHHVSHSDFFVNTVHNTTYHHQQYSMKEEEEEGGGGRNKTSNLRVFGGGEPSRCTQKKIVECGNNNNNGGLLPMVSSSSGPLWQDMSFESLLCNNVLDDNHKLLLTDLRNDNVCGGHHHHLEFLERGSLSNMITQTPPPWGQEEGRGSVLDCANIYEEKEIKQMMMINSTSGCCNNLFLDDPNCGGETHKSQERAMHYYYSL